MQQASNSILRPYPRGGYMRALQLAGVTVLAGVLLFAISSDVSTATRAPLTPHTGEYSGNTASTPESLPAQTENARPDRNEILHDGDRVPSPDSPSSRASYVTPLQSRDDLRRYQQSILIWPKKLGTFMREYASWEYWVPGSHGSSYLVRDELLASVRALAALIPDLRIDTHDPDSDLILVSGPPAMLETLLQRLRGHPLLERITADTIDQRNRAKKTWQESAHDVLSYLPLSPTLTINVRNPWVNNIVWGQTSPGAVVRVTLNRGGVRNLTSTAQADNRGVYRVLLAWEVRDGDLVDVSDGTVARSIPVLPLKIVAVASTASMTGNMPVGSEKMPRVVPELDMIMGVSSRRTAVSAEGGFTASFDSQMFRPGTVMSRPILYQS